MPSSPTKKFDSPKKASFQRKFSADSGTIRQNFQQIEAQIENDLLNSSQGHESDHGYDSEFSEGTQQKFSDTIGDTNARKNRLNIFERITKKSKYVPSYYNLCT